MIKQEILDYVSTSPQNTNPSVLSTMLDSFAETVGGNSGDTADTDVIWLTYHMEDYAEDEYPRLSDMVPTIEEMKNCYVAVVPNESGVEVGNIAPASFVDYGDTVYVCPGAANWDDPESSLFYPVFMILKEEAEGLQPGIYPAQGKHSWLIWETGA